jgi:hypothetical protein
MEDLATNYQKAIHYAYSEETLMRPSNAFLASAVFARADFGAALAKTPGALLIVPFGDDYAEPYTAAGAHFQVLDGCAHVYSHLTNVVESLRQRQTPRTMFQVLATDPDHDPTLADRCDYVAFKFVDHGIATVHGVEIIPVGDYRIVTEHEELEHGVGALETFWLLPTNK